MTKVSHIYIYIYICIYIYIYIRYKKKKSKLKARSMLFLFSFHVTFICNCCLSAAITPHNLAGKSIYIATLVVMVYRVAGIYVLV